MMDRAGFQLLERIAIAVEKLAEDPQVEIEAGPPICPNCGTFNPEITVFHEGQMSGPLDDYILEAECHICNSQIYGVVESWSMFRNRQQVIEEMQRRKQETERAGSNDGQ